MNRLFCISLALLIVILPPGAMSAQSKATPSNQEFMDSLKQKAARGDVAAQVELADQYYIQRDDALAVYWYRKAADRGNPEAQIRIGMMYEWGHMYEGGREVSKDDSKAADWYRKAADQGNSESEAHLGLMYQHGEGVPQDYAQAAQWYRKAADQGDASAQVSLGLLYGRGQGLQQDYAEANALFREAAEQGNALGQFNLGISYYKGIGISQDDNQAAIWFRKAAQQGNGGANERLNEIHSKQEGEKILSYWPSVIRVDTDMNNSWLANEERRCQSISFDQGKVSTVVCDGLPIHSSHNIPVTFWGDPNRGIISDWKCRLENSFLSAFVCRAIN